MGVFQTPAGERGDDAATDGQPTEWKTPEGHAAEGETDEGHAPHGNAPEGEAAQGVRSVDGRTAEGGAAERLGPGRVAQHRRAALARRRAADQLRAEEGQGQRGPGVGHGPGVGRRVRHLQALQAPQPLRVYGAVEGERVEGADAPVRHPLLHLRRRDAAVAREQRHQLVARVRVVEVLAVPVVHQLDGGRAELFARLADAAAAVRPVTGVASLVARLVAAVVDDDAGRRHADGRQDGGAVGGGRARTRVVWRVPARQHHRGRHPRHPRHRRRLAAPHGTQLPRTHEPGSVRRPAHRGAGQRLLLHQTHGRGGRPRLPARPAHAPPRQPQWLHLLGQQRPLVTVREARRRERRRVSGRFCNRRNIETVMNAIQMSDPIGLDWGAIVFFLIN